MNVPSLGHAGTRRRALRQLVPLDDGDLGEVVGEDPSGQQPGHAGAEHHGVVAANRCSGG